MQGPHEALLDQMTYELKGKLYELFSSTGYTWVERGRITLVHIPTWKWEDWGHTAVMKSPWEDMAKGPLRMVRVPRLDHSSEP